MSKVIITIGRQYGSGGREIGKKLAEKLNAPFYDNKLLEVAAKESGISKEIFEQNDEKPVNSLLYALSVNNYTSDTMPFNHMLFMAQFNAIKKIAGEGSCVIVGHCADYVLREEKNVFNIFVHADIELRTQRAVNLYDVPEKKARDVVLRVDKQRASYYNYYTWKKWGHVENYDLALDSGKLGIDNCVSLIYEYIKLLNKN